MKKVLIIGGTGTISTPITLKLAKDDQIQLTLMNRGKNNQKLPDSIEIIKADFNNKEEVLEKLGNRTFDVVMNFIVYTPQQAAQEIEIYQKRTQQYIFISTVASLNHDLTCLIDETTPQGNQYSEYGRNKEASEKVFLKAYQQSGFPITIIRPSQTYSNDRIPLSIKGKSTWGVIQRMLDEKEVIVHGDGQSVWASTHANDFCEMVYPVIGNSDCLGEIYQVMNNTSHTWDMVYRKLASLYHVPYKPIYISSSILKQSKQYDFLTSIQGDKHYSNLYDTQKIKALRPDYQCQISIEQGLEMYVEYMNQHPEKKILDPEFDQWCDTLIQRYQEATKDLMNNL